MKSKQNNQKRMVGIRIQISDWPVIKQFIEVPDNFPPMEVILGELTDEQITKIRNAVPSAVINLGQYIAPKIAVSKQHKKKVVRQFEEALKAKNADPLSEEKEARLITLIREIDRWED